MDFEVNINGEEKKFSQFDDVIHAIREHLAYWNNFGIDGHINGVQMISVSKVPSDTPTISVDVKDDIDAADIFGRR